MLGGGIHGKLTGTDPIHATWFERRPVWIVSECTNLNKTYYIFSTHLHWPESNTVESVFECFGYLLRVFFCFVCVCFFFTSFVCWFIFVVYKRLSDVTNYLQPL